MVSRGKAKGHKKSRKRYPGHNGNQRCVTENKVPFCTCPDSKTQRERMPDSAEASENKNGSGYSAHTSYGQQ